MTSHLVDVQLHRIFKNRFLGRVDTKEQTGQKTVQKSLQKLQQAESGRPEGPNWAKKKKPLVFIP